MRSRARRLAIVAMAVGLIAAIVAPVASARSYEVTITDMTSGQPLTPPVVATHRGKHRVFEVGQPASVGVREIAENGNAAPLAAFVEADPFGKFSGYAAGSEPLVPAGTPGAAMFGERTTLTVRGNRKAKRLSLVSMLICTNDGFTGVDGLKLPRKVGKTKTKRTGAYDANTERNTEDYADIVPPCQGLIGDASADEGIGVSNPDLAQGGVIAKHKGIQGGNDLDPGTHGWTDPVARIVVERVS